MNYLVNFYNFGNIAETHILPTEEKALEAFEAYVETIEDHFEKATCFYSCTPIQEEETNTTPNNKKTKNK